MLLFFTAGITLSLLAWVSVLGGTPELWSPFPLPLVLLLFFDVPLPLVIALPAVFFWAWNTQILKGNHTIPVRSIVLWVFISGLSASFFVTEWDAGTQFQSRLFTGGSLVLSIALFVLLFGLYSTAKKKPSFTLTLLYHFTLTFWLFSYAFPYIGEMP